MKNPNLIFALIVILLLFFGVVSGQSIKPQTNSESIQKQLYPTTNQVSKADLSTN